MSQTEPNTHQKQHQKHDNCENCVRQRKQNQSFIKIYQQLQAISHKTSNVKQAVQSHKSASDTTRSFYRTFEQKVKHLPTTKKEVNFQLIENVGFELAANIVEQEHRKKVMTENQHLKQLITKMRNEKWQKRQDSLDLMKSSCFTQRRYPEVGVNQLDRTYNSCQTPKAAQNQTQTLQKLLLSREFSQASEPNTTRSSAFNPASKRNSLNLGKYNGMNLWLYQSENHTKLEEQLYMSKRSKNNSFVAKTSRGRLASLKSRK